MNKKIWSRYLNKLNFDTRLYGNHEKLYYDEVETFLNVYKNMNNQAL